MLEEHALRYLLIRQVWALHHVVESDIYNEVSDSLEVSRDKKSYTLRWSRNKTAFTKSIPREAFTFYKKGDRANSQGALFEAERQNLKQARSFAMEALGLSENLEHFEPRPEGIRTQEKVAFAWIFALGMILMASDSERMFAFSLLLMTAMALEYVPRVGRLFASISIFGFAALGFPVTAMIAGFIYALLQWLDSNPKMRMLRVLLCISAGIFGLALIGISDQSLSRVLQGLGFFIVILPIVLLRWTIGSHFRALPLVVPFLAVSLAIEGLLLPASILTANAAACMLARLFGWRILKHPNASTFQGISKSTYR